MKGVHVVCDIVHEHVHMLRCTFIVKGLYLNTLPCTCVCTYMYMYM